ncbi:helix-turn-helix transcriptional regulator [Phenylobacterium sp. LjRoot219]|uniref:helix-turn-helix transcriptional regulator n=1 Tax=Phenylobacterium sp. LjRoot219 TaxID=3342283 RepID=UPI003ECF2DEC
MTYHQRMAEAAKGAIEVEAALRSSSAQVQLVRYHFAEPPESVLRTDGAFRVELCLTSRHRSSRGRFQDQWAAQRFERIGDIFVMPPNLELLAKSDEASSLTSIICELAPEPMLKLFDGRPALTDQHLRATLDVRDAKVRQVLLRLAEEAKQPGFASEMLVELLAGQLTIELFRLGGAIGKGQPHGGLAPWQLRLIDERLKEVREAPTLPVLADLCRISVRQLTRGFRASRGASIGAYVAESQMEHAKRLLASDQSVTAIAAALGFASSSNFCFAFRRAAGMTPGQFRQTLLRH